MAGRIERVLPGAPAEAALTAEIRRVQGRDRLAPVTVVVRSPIVGLSLRRRLAEEGAFAAVRFAPLQALLLQVGGIAAAAGGRQPLTQVALRAAARVALGEVPGVLGPVARHPATEASLAATYHDLRRASEAELDGLAADSVRARDVVALVRAIRRLLGADYYDATDLIKAAIDHLDGLAGADELAEVGSVVVFLPDPLGREEATLLARLAQRLDVLVLAGRTGDEQADRAVDGFVALLTERLGKGAVLLATADAAPVPSDDVAARAGCAGGLLSAPDDDVEVREAVRRLVAHAEAGGDLGRCVVTFPDGARSAEIGRRVAEQLTAAAIACSGGRRRLLGETPEARLLVGLVALAMPAPPERELDRGEVIAWLGSGPVRSSGGLTGGLATVDAKRGVPVGVWDGCSRAAGVLSGISQWRDRLRSHIARAREGARGRDSYAASATADLLEFVERLYTLTSAAVSAQSWAALRDWSDTALEEVLEPGDDRTTLAEALSDLALLDRIDPLGQLPPSERLRRFAGALEVAFERPAGDRGRYGIGPVVGPLSAVAGASSDLVLVLGCREGELPARQLDDPLVPRTERERVEALAQRERVEESARRHLVSVLCAATCSQASFARIDVRAGRAVYPSRWTAELFAGRPIEVPSFAGSIRRVRDGTSAAADLTDFELASLSDGASRASPDWLELLDEDYRRRFASLAHRRQGGLNPYAGYVPATGSVEDSWSDPLSATGLEAFAKCPFQFFVDRKLGVRKLEKPERLVMIDPRDRGTLMHEVLEGFFGAEETDGPITTLSEGALGRLRTLAAAQFERIELLGKTGKAVFWHTERARILRDLERYVARDIADSVAQDRRPLHVEFDFGGDDRPVVAEVAGRQVMFRGRIDRVDLTGDGRLVVVDYKSGKSDDYQEILSDPLGRGRHLQLPIYAKAAFDVLSREHALRGPTRGEYRFVQATAGYAIIPVELTEDVEGELHDVLATFVSTIDAGCFPPRPGAPAQGSHYANCRHCDFDALCTIDRAELWERASCDREMKAYTELVTGTE
ncbi:MAG: PD-(D/E)XK nuclease family protein [Acidimicrobiales bacterium]